jgi:hypothetical protein
LRRWQNLEKFITVGGMYQPRCSGWKYITEAILLYDP